ncbi:MAG: Riboflavin transporter [Alphaproteobacteria bacterium MarineAlpha11_Bin1]|nr:MAG: Riboflavin transporter [Alphaproteobacteria bacterium MarineAlpha11_Bin1]|tara:strand:- start:13622 stop:14494 length:873 start_codon:yes stop_codon:yes gene_type:complete
MNAARARWVTLPANFRAVLLVSAGAILLTVMAVFVKILGDRMSAAQLMFCRALVGFLLFAPWLMVTGGFDIIRTKRPFLHLQRGFWGACGNFCFFYSITHLVLADAMALQFSRPLFMILLAFVFLGEVAGKHRVAITCFGFVGILVMLRPFGGGFDPDGLVAVAGALFGGMVVICIKKLSSTEPTRRIIFYYALYMMLFSSIPAAVFWVHPTWNEVWLLVLVGFLGIVGQSCITHGFTLGEATITVPFDYMRIVYSAIFGIFLFSEIPSWWSLAGAILIVGSNLYLVKCR